MKRNNKLEVPRLRELILGGQDGLVNVLGIILGISVAGGSPHIIITASLAAAFAEAVSMGAVNYTSTQAEKEYYESELKKEYEEIEEKPTEEKKEIYDMFFKKGLRGKVLKKVVDTLVKDKDVWTKMMMEEELGLQVIDTKTLLGSSVLVALFTVVGSLVPLLPFFFFSHKEALMFSLAVSGLVLFGVGAYKAKTYVGSWWKSGLQMLLIGTGAAIVGFLIGLIFHSSPIV